MNDKPAFKIPLVSQNYEIRTLAEALKETRDAVDENSSAISELRRQVQALDHRLSTLTSTVDSFAARK